MHGKRTPRRRRLPGTQRVHRGPHVQQPERRPADVLHRPVRAACRRHGGPAGDVPHARFPAVIPQFFAHPRPGRVAAVQAADFRAERQGRARHHAPARGGAGRHSAVQHCAVRRGGQRHRDRHRPIWRGGRRGLGLVADLHREPGEAARADRGEPRAGPADGALRPARAGGPVARVRQVGAQERQVATAGQRRRSRAVVRAARRSSALTESGIR